MERGFDLYTFLLKKCINMKALEDGKKIHAHILKIGLTGHVPLANLLLNLYLKCGKLDDSRLLFDGMTQRNGNSWSSITIVYSQNGRSKDALDLFCQMRKGGVYPDRLTFVAALRACSNLAALQHGKQLHSQLIITGSLIHAVVLNNVLINMYCKCNCVDEARRVFDKMPQRDVVSWSSLLAGYSQRGHFQFAFKHFQQMRRAGIVVNQVACLIVMRTCAAMATLDQGKQIHSYAIKTNFDSDVHLGSSVVDMYAKCARIDDARLAFDRLPNPNVVTWTTLIAGYAQNENVEEALKIFKELPQHGIKPDEFVFSSVLSACASLSAYEPGRQIHVHIVKRGFHSQRYIENSLIEMYSKSGCIMDAHQVYELMTTRDVISWTTMIACYAHHGYGEKALQLFKQMQNAGIKPNAITFVCVLSACSHTGQVDEGHHYFDTMVREHGIMPTSEHYACMVDLLGRSGHIEEAEILINRMPFKPDASVWGALLGACRVHGNTESGRRAAKHLFELSPQCSGTHALLSNMYASAGRWDDVTKVRKLMKDSGVKKETGLSWMEIRSTTHAFAAGDRSHPESERIYAMLGILTQKMKDAGYSPNTNCVLHDVEEEQKEDALRYHSEKLALAFGLISTCPGTTIRIKKNLRICNDCHTSIKFISKIVERVVVVRDTKRFHNFSNGFCSCGDYW